MKKKKKKERKKEKEAEMCDDHIRKDKLRKARAAGSRKCSRK